MANNRKIVVKIRNEKRVIDLNEIIYIRSFETGCKLIFFDGEEKIIPWLRLKKIYTEIKELGFIRCHKSFLVNIDYIEGLKVSQCLLKNGIRIPIGRNYSKEFKEIFSFI